MRKLKTRTRDLMSTQTGGAGETIQAQPEIQNLPEEFSKDVSAPTQEPVVTPTDGRKIVGPSQTPQVIEPIVSPVDSEQYIAEQASLLTQTPSEEGGPSISTQGQDKSAVDKMASDELQMDVLPLIQDKDPMLVIDNDGSQENVLNPSYQTSLSTLTVPSFNFNETPIAIPKEEEEGPGDPVFFNQDEKDAYELKREMSNFSPEVVSYVDQVEGKETQKQDQLKRNNEILKDQTANQTTYDKIANSVQMNQYTSFQEDLKYDDMRYGPSANMKTYLNVFGLSSEDLVGMAESAAASTGKDIVAEYADNVGAYSSLTEYVNNLEDVLKNNVSNDDIILSDKTTTSGVYLEESITKGKPLNQVQRQAISKQLEWAKKQKDIAKKDVENFNFDQKFDPKSSSAELKTQPDLYKKFENQTNWKLKEVYGKKWTAIEYEFPNGTKVTRYEIPHYKQFAWNSERNEDVMTGGVASYHLTAQEAKVYKDYARWIDNEGRELIKQDVKNGTSNYLKKEKQLFGEEGAFKGNVTTEIPWIAELRNDVFEVEAHKYYSQTGKVDNFTYSGFKATASRIYKQNKKQVNETIKTVSNDILSKGQQQEKEWISKNRKILISQIDDVKKRMDDLLKQNLETAMASNPQANSIYDQYSSRIAVTENEEEKKKLTNEMMVELKKYPTITKTFNEYNSALEEFVSKAQNIYTQSYSNFKQKLYESSVEELKDGLVNTLRQVYRSGVNNDINTYEYANQIVKDKAFKEASFYTKRKMISDAWEYEKSNIISMVKSGKIKYPKDASEAGKHWSQWSGVRPMTAEEKKKWTSELPERTGGDARAKFIFYAVDDLLYNPKGKPSVYAIQAFAREQLNELQAKRKALGLKDRDALVDAAYAGRGKEKDYALGVSEAKQMLITEDYLNKIISTPETDQGTWSEFTSGLVDGFQIPFLGAVLGIQEKNTLKSTIDRYQKAGMDGFDISLVDAYAAMNKLSQIRPNTTAYNIGSGLGFTSTFMLEMMATGGLNSIGRGVGLKITDAILSIGKSATDDVVRTSVEAAAQTPAYIERTKNLVGFFSGGIAEGVVNPRAYEMSLERMIDNVSVQESGAYDGLIAIVDRNSGEGTFEAFSKGYANWLGMTVIERLGAHLPNSKLTQNVAQYLGTSTFMKRAFIGKFMRDYGFKTVDEAADFASTNKTLWSGFLPEMMEEVLQGGWEALITGDSPVFGTDDNGKMNYMGMTTDELQTTAAVVAIFGTTMNLARRIRASISSDEKNVSIESEDENGTVSIVNMNGDTWKRYNNMMADENLTWRAISKMMSEDETLSPEQESAIANVLIQMRGKEILEDENYQDWRSKNIATVTERAEIEKLVMDTRQKAYDILTEDQKKRLAEDVAIEQYQFSTTSGIPIAEDMNQLAMIFRNEEKLNNPDITVVSTDQEGNTVETDVSDNSTVMADKKKSRKAKKLTPGRKRAPKTTVKEEAPKEEGIQFEMPRAEGAVTEEVPATESTITTPIDLTNDTENITGVPGQVAEGQEPVQAQPIAEAGQETPGVSGVVQEEQVQTKVVPKNKKEREEAGLRGDVIYHIVEDSIYETTPEEYNAALKEIAETGAIANAAIGKKISEKQAPSQIAVGYAPNLMKLSQEDAQSELDQRTKAAPTQTTPEAAPAETAPAKATNLDERLKQIQEEREAIRNDATLSQEERSNKLRELRAESIEIFSEKQKQIDNEIDSKMGRTSAETAPVETVNKTQDDIDALNERINEIYNNGEEDTKEGRAEINILNERLSELENQSKQEKIETVTAEKQAVAEEEVLTEEDKAAQSFKDRFLNLYNATPERNKKKRRDVKNYISGQQSSLDRNEGRGAELALSEIDRLEQEAKAQAKPTARGKVAEGPKAKTDSDGFVSVESSVRGVQNKPEYDEKGKLVPKGFYSVKVSEDGTKADVKDPLGNVDTKLKVSTTDAGDRYVVYNGNMVYVDRAVMDSKAVEKEEVVTEEKTGAYKKRVPGFYPPGKKTANVGMSPTEINQLKQEAETLKKDPNYANNKKSINRVKEIEDIINSNKGKVSPKAAELAEALAYDPKSEEFSGTPSQAGIVDPLSKPYGKQIDEARDKKQITEEEHKALSDFLEQKKIEYYNNKAKSKEQKETEKLRNEASKLIDDAIKSEDTPPENIEALQDESAQAAAEVAIADTKKQGKKKKTNSKSATRRRGATVGFTEALLTRLANAFPKYITGIDTTQAGFQAAARATGRSMNSAAILYNGVVYLNDRVANENTALEEFAHIYLLVMKANNLPLYNRGLKLIQSNGTEYIDEVINDPGYAYIHSNQSFDELTEKEKEEVSFEALSKMIADRGETVLEESRKSVITSFLKNLWRNLTRLIMGWGTRKLDLVRDDIDSYTNVIARELLSNRPISTVSPEMLKSIMNNDTDLKPVPLSRSSVMNFKSNWVGIGKRLFAANKGLGDQFSNRLTAPTRKIKAIEKQVQFVVNELNKAIKDYNKATKKQTGTAADLVQLKQDIDQALKDTDFRTDFFNNDALADQFLKPSILKMRGIVDAMSKELADSGLFGEALVASINANNDVYLHTSYYIFSKASEQARQNWLSYFSDQDQEEILQWIYDGGYTKAVGVDYQINPTTGKITISFKNSFGINSEEKTFNTTDEVKQYIKDNVKTVIGSVPANIDAYTFNAMNGSIDLGAAMNIDNTQLKYEENRAALVSAIEEMVKNDEKGKLKEFLSLNQQIVSSPEASITKKKQQQMNETKKKFLMEIRDPAFNFANTVAKQAGLLYKSQLEQEIIDSGFLAFKYNPASQSEEGKGNWRKVTNPNSNLYNYYIPTEIYDTIFGSGVINDRNNGVFKFVYSGSAITKMALTIYSIGANSANYVSGWFQLAKTGGLPLNLLRAGHNASLMAVGQQMDTKANAASWIFNLTSNTIRHIVTIRQKSSRIANMNLPLSAFHQAKYGTDDFSALKPKEQAQVLSDELVEMGIINSGVEAEALRNLSEYAFNNVDIPENILAQEMSKLSKFRRTTKKVGRATSRAMGKIVEAAADTYSFSDSVFKAMMYLNHKEFNMSTYGEEMRRNGMTAEQIDAAIKQKTAEQVRKQMPTYDRSPEFLRFLSRFPIIGPFVQFDFQNKVNDKNILIDAARMMTTDAARMMKNGMAKEASMVFMKGAYKASMAITSQFLSYALYSLISSSFGWDDDDDEAFRKTQPSYRQYNTLIHLDSNKTGKHTYVDINRVLPQALYLKYYRALKEDGVGAFVSEFFDPYIKQDVFVGSVLQTFQGINKYGVYDKYLAELPISEKLQYILNERLLPSTSVGQVEKVVRAIQGEESSEGIPGNAANEVMNMFTGIKLRTEVPKNNFARRITYQDIKEIETQKSQLNKAIKERDKRIEQMERGVEAATAEDVQSYNDAVQQEYNKFNEFMTNKMNELYELADSYRKLGYTDDELYNVMVEEGTPQYFADAILNRTTIEFDEFTGERIQYKAPKSMFEGGFEGGFESGFEGGFE